MKFIVYNNTTGAILRTGECPDADLALQAQTGETAIEGEANDATQYIDGGSVVSRPALTAVWNKSSVTANGSDTATFGSTLPNPTIVTVVVPDGAETPPAETVTIGTFSFATPVAGEYTITVSPPFPYKPIIKTITAI